MHRSQIYFCKKAPMVVGVIKANNKIILTAIFKILFQYLL